MPRLCTSLAQHIVRRFRLLLSRGFSYSDHLHPKAEDLVQPDLCQIPYDALSSGMRNQDVTAGTNIGIALHATKSENVCTTAIPREKSNEHDGASNAPVMLIKKFTIIYFYCHPPTPFSQSVLQPMKRCPHVSLCDGIYSGVISPSDTSTSTVSLPRCISRWTVSPTDF